MNLHSHSYAIHPSSIVVAFAAVVLAALLFAPAAQAAEVRVSGDALEIVAAPGERNDVALTGRWSGATQIDVRDFGAPLTAGSGCERVDGARVTCAGGAVARYAADLGDLDDHIRAEIALPGLVSGGDGDDQLEGGPGKKLRGDAGNDGLFGGAGNDRLLGGDGGDGFEEGRAGGGADLIDGGPGHDRLSYELRVGSVNLTEDGVANDGAPGEGDNILPVMESFAGGAGDDVLTGDGGPDVIDGGARTDTTDYQARSAPVTVTEDGSANDGAPGEGDNVLTGMERFYGGAGTTRSPATAVPTFSRARPATTCSRAATAMTR